MNKGELAAAIAEKSGLTKKDALAAVDAFVEACKKLNETKAQELDGTIC